MSGSGDANRLVRALRRRGIYVEKARRGGHWRAIIGWRIVIFASTPGSRYTLRNAVRDIAEASGDASWKTWRP